MKQIIIFLAALVLFASCEKLEGGIQKGTYSASVTAIGMLNIELLSDEKCIIYFTDGPESSGYYHVDGDQISIIGHVYTTDDWGARKFDSFRFSSDKPGTIYSKTSFGIEAESLLKDKMYYCSFTKRN